MKLLKISIAFAIVFVLFTSIKCKKNKTQEAELPPETTTGAMTFGCKVNGKVFVPKDGRGKPGLFVQYVNLGAGVGGGWFLNIPATNWESTEIPTLQIGTDSLLITENSTYQFKINNNNQSIKGTAFAKYASGSSGYIKLNSDVGDLIITRFDQVNRILSGRFYFIATNTSNGEKINITEGRFDIRY
jgi:Family of unknown function (DUF6252)